MRPRFQYRAECGACGHRRAWRTADHIDDAGQVIGTVTPNSPGGPLDRPCPACGTAEREHVRRCWHGPHQLLKDDSAWRYAGVGLPGQGWRVPLPPGDWPKPVQLPDDAPGQQLAFAVAA